MRPIPPLLRRPRRFPGHLPSSASKRESRVRAPGRLSAPDTSTAIDILGDVHQALRWRSGRPRADGGARPSRSASELMRSHSPCRISCHRRFASRRPRDPVSARDTLQSACQSAPRSGLESVRSRIHCDPSGLAMRCQRAFRACERSGEARCHPVRGDDSNGPSHINWKRRSAFATVTPGVTLHAAVTRP